ncbi:MAG: hypothetical protein IJ240_08255 [Clostridia bacterium]|nr:hypothetical protein [Clostridia bacterium]
MLKSIKNNPGKFYLNIAACAIGLIALILYLATGVIPGYTDALSTGAIVALAIAVCGNLIFSFVRVNTLESLPFAAYIVGALLILYANAEYLVTVIRGIDVTVVQPTLIITLALTVVAAVVYAVSFCVKKK